MIIKIAYVSYWDHSSLLPRCFVWYDGSTYWFCLRGPVHLIRFFLDSYQLLSDRAFLSLDLPQRSIRIGVIRNSVSGSPSCVLMNWDLNSRRSTCRLASVYSRSIILINGILVILRRFLWKWIRSWRSL